MRLRSFFLQDIVDILVGWHVDTGQSPTLKMQISSVLLSWHSFWIIDLEFSAGLLSQFVEDIGNFNYQNCFHLILNPFNITEQFDEEIEDCESSSGVTICLEKIASVLQVFNSVLSCLR